MSSSLCKTSRYDCVMKTLLLTVFYFAGISFTSVRLSFYMENFIGFMKPEKQEDGSYMLG